MKKIFSIIIIIISCTWTLLLAQDFDLKEFIGGSNEFTSAVYKQIAKELDAKENFLVCPFSVETVMALTLSGAKDETREEIRSALKLSQDQDKIYTTFKSVLPQIRSREEYYFNTANKIYTKTNLTLNQDFSKIAEEVFVSGVEDVDFGRSDEAAKIMNQWVSEQTEDKIKDLINPSKISERTSLILINALYFKGNWSKPFESVADKVFYRSTKDQINATMMTKTDFFGYAENAELNAKFLELHFSADNVSLILALPNDKDGLGDLEYRFERVIGDQNFTETVVEVCLPKFKVSSKIIFNEILKSLGVKRAFSEEADLSGIAGSKGNLFISDVIQKAFMDVNEEGVEAAAASYVGIVLRDSIDTSNRKFFIADHPFLFILKIKGIPIFAGRIVDPKY